MKYAWKTLLAGLLSILFALPASGAKLGCSASAEMLYAACGFDAGDDFFTSKARCLDSSDSLDGCLAEAALEQEATLEECDDVFGARLELCEDLDDAPHEPTFGPDFVADFVDPLEIGTLVTP
ncbi:MAG: hypothetical protein V3U43_08495, partial [Pseudomonadales bacterium]